MELSVKLPKNSKEKTYVFLWSSALMKVSTCPVQVESELRTALLVSFKKQTKKVFKMAMANI